LGNAKEKAVAKWNLFRLSEPVSGCTCFLPGAKACTSHILLSGLAAAGFQEGASVA